MSTTKGPVGENEFSDSDQQWLNRLVGKPGLVSSPQAVEEADALRLAVDQDVREVDSDPELEAALSDAEHRRRWEQLQFRRRREGLLKSEAAKPWWRQWPAAAGLAAAVLMTTVLVQPWQYVGPPDYDQAPEMRGETLPLQVRVPKPREAAEKLAAALRQAGIKAGLYQRGKTYIVDTDLAPDELAAAEPLFRALGLTAKAGFSRVEISAP